MVNSKKPKPKPIEDPDAYVEETEERRLADLARIPEDMRGLPVFGKIVRRRKGNAATAFVPPVSEEESDSGSKG